MSKYYDLLKKMKENHLDRQSLLLKAKSHGIDITGYDDGKTLDDRINEEELAIENIDRNIERAIQNESKESS